MSNQENQSKPALIKKIEVGKFYFIHDGSKTGHPGFVIMKNDDKNRYLVIRFDSDKYGDIPKKDRGVKHITKLKYALDDKVMNSYAKNRPLLCRRKDIGFEMLGLKIHKSDMALIQDISKRHFELAPSFRK